MGTEITTNDPEFYNKIAESHASLESGILTEEYFAISVSLDATAVQESCSVRNVLKARKLAEKLINDEGELQLKEIPYYIKQLEEGLYSLSPGREHDRVRDEHILTVLKRLQSDKDLIRVLRHLNRPVSNRIAEDIVRDALCLDAGVPIHDCHVRRACLSAWFTYLRQSLGSCFATAPAIIIQQEQPRQFLHDIDELMNTGRLKRTFGGVEYVVPMSHSWGNGDLRKPIILHNELKRSENKIWTSYGLIKAFVAVGLIDEKLESEKKSAECLKLLERSYPSIACKREYVITNVEELIEATLLSLHKLTRSDVEAFQNKPKAMIYSGLIMHVPKIGKKSAVNPYPAYLADVAKAKTVFKAIADNALLKAWEFTIASFSEIKLNFTRWNLYASLGINFDDRGGIGECLYRIISTKIDHANAQLKSLSDEYEQAAIHMRYLEGRMKSASTEKEIEFIKVEYQSRQTELYHIEQMRSIAHEKATKVSNLHQFLTDEYDKKFCDYFQEVYDPEIHEISSGPFDDSPAGFRLLYKHGRSNPSQWTYIRSHLDFIEALVSFFTITEQELSSHPAVKGIEQDFSLAITQLVNHVRSDEFIESAFYRMAAAHNARCPAKPLENLDKVEKKPWVYTSGGSMSTLVSAYFHNEHKPFEVSRWVESETELLAYFVDTIRQLPGAIGKLYEHEPDRSMLIHSPTHAFLFKPGYSPFNEGSASDMYSYSWIKNTIIEPQIALNNGIEVNLEVAKDVLSIISNTIPNNNRPRLQQLAQQVPYNSSLKDFREFLLSTLATDRGLRGEHGALISPDSVDSLIYSTFPYTSFDVVRDEIIEVVNTAFESNKIQRGQIEKICNKVLVAPIGMKSISAKKVLEIAKAIAILSIGKTRSSVDLIRSIIEQLRVKKILFPKPIIIADTNWVKDYFAFVMNPATSQLEFWSVDLFGMEGKPISHWKMWLNGSRKEPNWGLYTKPYEYVSK